MANESVAKSGKGVGLAEYIDQQIADRIQIVRDAQEQISLLDEQIQLLKTELRELLEQKGSNWSDTQGYARLTAEGTRTSYDTRALDGLILNEPLQYGWLKDFRKESTVRSGVQIK
ncbi:MAG: hypothetical protein ABI690_04205 [Chloroflexota bacterium]